jgi:hypothetical protein
MVTRLQQSLTRTARTRIHVSRRDVQTQLRRMAGVAATSMRSTRGCGSLDVASLALAAWQSRRLRIGRILPAKRQASVGRRLLMAARVMVPEMKCELDLYVYVLVQTQYVLFTPSTYSVRTIFPVYVRGTYWYVLCLQKYGSGCCLMLFACAKCVWHVCCYWISAPIGVQHTWHYFGTYSVGTSMYLSVLLYISITSLYSVRNSTYWFRTCTY